VKSIRIIGAASRCALFCWAVLAASNAAAQPVPVLPPEVSPGVLQDQLRRLSPQPPSDTRSLSSPVVPRTVRPQGAETRRVTIRAVELSGNTAIPTAQLASAWSELVGREQPASAVYDLADTLTGIYRNRGFVLSAVVAPQDIPASGLPDGVLRLTAVEGFVGKVAFEPDFTPTARMRREAEAIAGERPLTIVTLERQLLLINDLAGVTAQAFFEPAGPPGEALLTLKVTRRPVTAFVGVQNRVSKLLGHVALEGRVSLNNPLGLDDSHTLLLQTSDETRLRSIGYVHDQPLGNNGLALNLFLGHVESKTAIPEADLLNRGFSVDEWVRSTSDIASIGLSYPLIRSRGQTLRLRARFGAYDGKQEAFDVQQRDRVRALRLGASWDRSDAWGVNYADLEFSKGLRGLGSTSDTASDAIRTGADYGFSKFTFFAGRLQQLGGDFSLQGSVQGQWTNDRLPPSERAALGGDLILRAFNAGELIGDRALAGRVELRYEPPWMPGGRVSLYGFGELGRTKSLEIAPTIDLVTKGGTAGFGVRGTLFNGINFYAEVAKPYLRDVDQTHSRRARFFAGLSYQY
jgi:hemolysin activation/secretion protein